MSLFGGYSKENTHIDVFGYRCCDGCGDHPGNHRLNCEYSGPAYAGSLINPETGMPWRIVQPPYPTEGERAYDAKAK